MGLGLEYLLVEDVSRGLSFVDPDIRFKPGQDSEPHPVPSIECLPPRRYLRLHCQWNPNVGREANFSAAEVGRCDADYSK